MYSISSKCVAGILAIWLLAPLVSAQGSSSSIGSAIAANDQCNTTQQCQATYGNRATDCRDSRSSKSVCMCGSKRCDQTGSGGGGGSKVLLETGGLVAIEAESYSSIKNKGFTAKWRLTSKSKKPKVRPDPDGPHLAGSSGAKYLEILPDRRVKHSDRLIKNKPNANLFDRGGDGPRVNYRVYFNNPGTYYVWLRAFSTGSEDNGAHVGVNGRFPQSGSRVQWCDGKNRWTWSSAQRRDSNHCGRPSTITLKIPSKGIHTISVSMREDGFELDKIIMAKKKSFKPSGKSVAQKFYRGKNR